MSGRQGSYTVEQILDHLDGNFDIPDDGMNSDVEGLEEDYEGENLAQEDDLFDEEEDISLQNIDIIEEDDSNEDFTGPGRPQNVCVANYDWLHEDSELEIPTFNGEVGPTKVLSEESTAIHFLLLYIDDRILGNIVRETNRYASQEFEKKNKDISLWTELTINELKAFLGLLVAMSIKRLPSIRDYWSQDWVLGVAAFAKVMPRNRFLEIAAHIHLNDNSKQPGPNSPNFDKLFKIRRFIDDLKANFAIQYNPHCHQVVDEEMIKFKGRTSLKQYLPLKPIKRGIKMWCCADSHSGYLCDFDIYTGRQRNEIQHGLGYSVVTSLSQSIKGHWYRVFFDNFFTSYKLLEDLYANKILGCGTMRQGCKGFPRELFDKENLKQMKRGDTMWRMKGPILATAWMDKKAVFVSGTVCSAPPDQLPEVQRRQKDGTHQNVPCPPIISTYNQYMGGVDKNDQMRSYYPIPAFGKKWWCRIFYDLIDRSIFNEFVLEQESPNHNKRTLKDFRIAIAKELIGDFSSRRKRGRASLDALEARYTERHFPEYLPSNEAGKILLRRCKVCYDNGTRKRTSYCCPGCDVPLCVAPCFRHYHQK